MPRMETPRPPSKVPGFCSIRYGLAGLLHFCNLTVMAQRLCLNLTMVAMVNSTQPQDLSNTSAVKKLDDVKNPVYNWGVDVQGVVLSSIFYGLVVAQIPVGYVSGLYPMKRAIGSALFLGSILSLLIPLGARVGASLVIVCRLLQGITQGAVQTGQHEIWVKWAPPLERGRLTSLSMSGVFIAPFLVMLLSGFISDLLGWPMVFYIFDFLLAKLNQKAEVQELWGGIVDCFQPTKYHLPLQQGTQRRPSLPSWMIVLVRLFGLLCQREYKPLRLNGAFGCLLSIFWFFLFYDDPKEHPYISTSEKEYITSSLTQQDSPCRQSLPIKAMLKSLPLWAIILSQFAFTWSNSFLVTYTPMFLSRVLHVNIRENGLLSSLPYLIGYICGILTGPMSDFFLSRKILSPLAIRKFFTTLGILCPVVFCLCLLYLSFDFPSTVIFLTLANATPSFALGGILINALDIAPRYYGFLKAITTLSGMIGGLISSTVAGLILNQDPERSWHKIFLLMAGIDISGLTFYLVFAQAKVQDWAKDTENTRL